MLTYGPDFGHIYHDILIIFLLLIYIVFLLFYNIDVYL